VIAPGLTIAPPWDAPEGAIIVEPAMAFGTGDHPSTRECLKAIAKYARSGGDLLDVGTGSGILAIAGTRYGMRAKGIDTDPQAIQAAQENAARNHFTCDFSTIPLQRVEERYDLVMANLFAEVLVQLAPELLRVTNERLICAGILSAKADTVIEALSELHLDARIDDGEWVCLHWSRA
jgi:ribosomal protein L11 methyltransferase